MLKTPSYIHRVSYDFDGTLERPDIQLYALNDVINKKEVYILTKRTVNENDSHGPEEVLAIANKLGIPFDRVIFTNGGDKYEYIESLGIQLHYDDNQTELLLIEKYTDCITRKV